MGEGVVKNPENNARNSKQLLKGDESINVVAQFSFLIAQAKHLGDCVWQRVALNSFGFSKEGSPKGQLISKAIYGLLTSPKKPTDKFVLFAFLLFTANKSDSFVRFLGESTSCKSAFWFYLTFISLYVDIVHPEEQIAIFGPPKG